MIEKILERARTKSREYIHKSNEEASKNGNTLDFERFCGKKEAYEDMLVFVQEEAKEYGNGWIPCSERLPEFDQEVLITADDCTVYQCVMRNGGLCVFEDGWIDTKHVLAWQPLPAPYQKGE